MKTLSTILGCLAFAGLVFTAVRTISSTGVSIANVIGEHISEVRGKARDFIS
jgi:hypothetical protein